MVYFSVDSLGFFKKIKIQIIETDKKSIKDYRTFIGKQTNKVLQNMWFDCMRVDW